jgi:FtsP/CotA-like multicopper oxidase with cupredoxin domain
MKDSKKLAVTRRRFIAQTAALTAGAALAGALPRAFAAATCPTETLKKIGEIASIKGKLKGVLKIKNGPKALPGYAGSQLPMMRYFEGYNQQLDKPPVWPPDKTGCNPGPTLRVAVGEHVEITFLNQVDVGAFPGGTLDNAETGATTGCDQATNATTAPPDKKWYPNTRGDSFPNCFHGSSTANLHFHGTHVTPDGFGDNVLVQIRPDPKITEKDVEPMFDEIFKDCSTNGSTPPWEKLPKSYRDMQEAAVKNYDLHAIWQGTRGPVKDPSGKDVPALPFENQLSPANEDAINAGMWPQYFIGAFPNCFKITEAAGHEMGQAPGTHWYHSHKHGSTSINLYNGLAGALIIEGQYDEDLKKIYPDLKKTEKVLVVQDFTDLPNLERPKGGGATKSIMTNGTQVVAAVTKAPTSPQQAPTIVMRPGEIQLWRLVNAQVENNINGAFVQPPGAAPLTLPVFRQIAQDGVQFRYENYVDQPFTSPDANHNATKFTLTAGGRMDFLVQAPANAGNFEFSGVANLIVCGTPVTQSFPVEANYPVFPPFLYDLPKPHNYRTLTFDWEPFRIGTGGASTTVGTSHSKQVPFVDTVGNPPKEVTIKQSMAPIFMIDNEQFSEHKYYQTMVLGEEEEWTIINTTIVPHPFHIHVNPFQVVEIFDPNLGGIQRKWDKFGVWQDVIAIPSALKDANGKLDIDPNTGLAKTPGYLRVRSRFVDFTGSFVLHCHILAHEDRGMMQLVRVISGKTTLRHH